MEEKKEARYYEKLPDGKVKCQLCPHTCLISQTKRGICRVRENQEGRLYTLNYGRITAIAMDPMEKKPLYHFYPGRWILSVGTFGCNFHCQFCQNWQIAHGDPETLYISPEALVDKALELESIGIAYTYSEPIVWFEYVLDTAKLAQEAGLKNVMVTNGYINPEPLAELLPFTHAWNIDIKGFNPDFYRRIVGGRLEPVLATAKAVAKAGKHLEITTLLVTGLNDNLEELEQLVLWIRDNLGPDTPLHFSRYFPQYRLHLPPTPLETLYRARDMARRYLNHVYLGNVPDTRANSTYCPRCGSLAIRRTGYDVEPLGLSGGNCRECGTPLAIVREEED
ncbi:MAG TPA: AmmeMemoRadiSam system radical SAM enzyme [Moorella mulderi]|nr:AmmeMemoRadiSam system radical SAM enzyme [Moorella mulderi]